MKRILVIACIAIVVVAFFSAAMRGCWLDNQYESVSATIVTTGTTRGILENHPWTLYKTERGRIHRPGIWGEPGDKLIIQVKKY